MLKKISSIDDNAISEFRKSGISELMKSVESSDWAIAEELNDKIVGVAFMGGLFHVSGIQLLKEFQGKGLGKKLQNELIVESKKHNYSFITMFNDPRNEASENLHNSLGYKKLFRINYAPDVKQDFKIISFNTKGKILSNFLKIFNTKGGMFLLGLMLKSFFPIFIKFVNHTEDNRPNPNLKWILNNFEKI